jgi:diketogulonate reductase-like aldo/keto reductase
MGEEFTLNPERETERWAPTRRDVIKAGGLAAAAAAGAGLTGAGTGHAAPDDALPPDLITRVIPGTNERLPLLGLGTFLTFDTLPGQPIRHLREVARRFWRSGGRVFDVSPLYGASERNLGEIARSLGINNRLFMTNKIWACGDYLWDDSDAERDLRRSVEILSRNRPIDVVQVHSLINVDTWVPLLHAWKREGRIRRLGVTSHDPLAYPILANWVERGDVDFVQVHYSIHTRQAEERVIRAAVDNNVAVQVNMALEKGRLHAVVGDRPLPDFARAAGIRSWAEYFLKWVGANPAVTNVLTATSNPDHIDESLAAMRGTLPDPELREQMRRHVAAFPGFEGIATMPWYPNRTYSGLITRAQASIRRRSPWWPS